MKTRVLFCCVGIETGGIEKSLINLLNHINYNYFEVDLILWNPKGSLIDEVNSNVNIIDGTDYAGIKKFSDLFLHFKLGDFIKYILYKLFEVRNLGWKLYKKVSKEYDIAVSYSHYDYSPFFIIDKCYSKKKYAWYHNGKYLETAQRKKLDSKYFMMFDKIFAVSNSCKKMLHSNFPDLHNIDVFPNWVDIEKAKKLSEECLSFQFSDRKNLKILTIGRLAPEKDILRVVDIALLLRQHNISFQWFIAGDGPLKDSLSELIIKKNIEDSVKVLGNISNPFPLIKQCSVYVQFSIFESESLTIKEVSIFNKKIVVTDIDAFVEASAYINNICLAKSDNDFYNYIVKDIVIKNNEKLLSNDKFELMLNKYFYSLGEKSE